MSKTSLVMLVLAITAAYFGVFGWFLAFMFVFYVGARTWLKFEEPAKDDAEQTNDSACNDSTK